MKHTFLHGDCTVELKKLAENSVDAIVTDPPYELGFMGKAWDSTGVANNVDMWREALRVLKPGGYLLAFSGTRTYHRMASAIEDAGFEVRDMIEWVYGSGFPKSLNIGKKIDEIQGNERSEYIDEDFIKRNPKDNSDGVFESGLKDGIDGAKRTVGTSEWEGWGTALKPAHEPICMARKPLSEKTVAENCLKWGTGGINIDESRVESNGEHKVKGIVTKQTTVSGDEREGKALGMYGAGASFEPTNSELGRFPANLIHDNSEEVRECFPETKGGGSQNGSRKWKGEEGEGGFGGWAGKVSTSHYISRDDGTGNASRFFKSIKTNDLCSLCYLPCDTKHSTMSVCTNTSVSSAEKSLTTTQVTTEVIAPQNATTPDNKKFAQSVKSVANLCDLCGTYIAHVLVEEKPVHQEGEARGQVFIAKHKKQILDNVLASFVELRGKKDTTPTINDLNLLFGFVFSAIENSTIYFEKESVAEKNLTQKSLLYQAKASRSERTNKGELSNPHPTIKPIALMEYLITMVTPKGGTVLDPFMGSGTTGVACINTGRTFIGVEMNKEYIDIAQKRLNSEPVKLFS